MKLETDLEGRTNTTFMTIINNKEVYGKKEDDLLFTEKKALSCIYLWVDKDILRTIEEHKMNIWIDEEQYILTSTKINRAESDKEEIIVILYGKDLKEVGKQEIDNKETK